MKALRALVLLSILLAACAPVIAPDSADEGMSSSAPSAMGKKDDGDAMENDDEEAAAPRVIEITADNWSFSPSSITVRKGEKVTVRLTGRNGIHGFAVPDLGVNERVEAGKTVDVTLATDATGTFNFFCSIPCGSGHKEMTGTITVTE